MRTPPAPVIRAFPCLIATTHEEITDQGPDGAAALVDLLHERLGAPRTGACLAVCLGLTVGTLRPLMATFGPLLEVSHILKLRDADQLDRVRNLSTGAVEEIEFALEAHGFISGRRSQLPPSLSYESGRPGKAAPGGTSPLIPWAPHQTLRIISHKKARHGRN